MEFYLQPLVFASFTIDERSTCVMFVEMWFLIYYTCLFNFFSFLKKVI